MTNIAVIGAGHVGLTVAVAHATWGQRVRVLDISSERVAMLNEGNLPLDEPNIMREGLHAMSQGLLEFTTDPGHAFDECCYMLLCVPTDAGGDGEPHDMSCVDDAAATVKKHKPHGVLVVKSTVPVGTCRRLAKYHKMHVVSCPEFLAEGTALKDYRYPERVVVGVPAVGDFFGDAVGREFANIRTGGFIDRDRVHYVSYEEAELAKLASNAMLAMRVSFANIVARQCEAHPGADAGRVLDIVRADPRIGFRYLSHGMGYGGSCLAKDLATWGATHTDAEFVAEDVEVANRAARRWAFERLLELFDGDLAGKRIAVFGVAFKAGTGDVRDAPGLALARKLRNYVADVVVWDPQVHGDDLPDEVESALGPVGAARGADAIVVCHLPDVPGGAGTAHWWDMHVGLVDCPVIDAGAAFDEEPPGATYIRVGVGR